MSLEYDYFFVSLNALKWISHSVIFRGGLSKRITNTALYKQVECLTALFSYFKSVVFFKKTDIKSVKESNAFAFSIIRQHYLESFFKYFNGLSFYFILYIYTS